MNTDVFDSYNALAKNTAVTVLECPRDDAALVVSMDEEKPKLVCPSCNARFDVGPVTLWRIMEIVENTRKLVL